jgi:TatD DNase family protein
MSLRLYDAHNHLQDERLAPHLGAVLDATKRENVVRMVVNGACEGDWPDVLALAQKHSQIIASFGYHPWYVKERTADWHEKLLACLDAIPSAVGEIGLDRWINDRDDALQEEMFRAQLSIAAERDLPASIHCLKAWGKVYDVLRAESRPRCGFLLHSFGGPVEMIEPLARLGAYFSIPGYFALERKGRQRETFLHVPPERLLIETDAPDQLLPVERVRYPLSDGATGKPLNHPANLRSVYEFTAELLGKSLEELAGQIEENFRRLFGGVLRGPESSINSR